MYFSDFQYEFDFIEVHTIYTLTSKEYDAKVFANSQNPITVYL